MKGIFKMNKVYIAGGCEYNNSISHHGIKGQKWGERRYQNPDGTLTEEGRKRYSSYTPYKIQRSLNKIDKHAASIIALRNEAAAKSIEYARKGMKYANKHGDSEKTTKKLAKLDKKIKKQKDSITSLEDIISMYDNAAQSRVNAALEKGYDVTIKNKTRTIMSGKNFIESLGISLGSAALSVLTGVPAIAVVKQQKVKGNQYKVRKNKSNSEVGNLIRIDDNRKRR